MLICTVEVNKTKCPQGMSRHMVSKCEAKDKLTR